jgi:hypothetical protein
MNFISITPLSDMCYFFSGVLIAMGIEQKQEKRVIALLAIIVLIAMRWDFADWGIVSIMGLLLWLYISLLNYPMLL